MPAPLARTGRHTGMDEQAQFIHKVSREQCSGERSAAVHADQPGAVALAQSGERRREIDALPSRHELPHSPVAGVPRGGVGTEREDVRPVSALAQCLPFTDAPAAVDDSKKRAIRRRARPGHGRQCLLLGEDGVGPRERHVLLPAASERVEPLDVRLEAGGCTVQRNGHMDDDERMSRGPGQLISPTSASSASVAPSAAVRGSGWVRRLLCIVSWPGKAS
jgi:hypothetical protein